MRSSRVGPSLEDLDLSRATPCAPNGDKPSQISKPAPERLRDGDELYRLIADHSPDWDFWVGADGRYEYVSPVCQQVCGYSPEEFLADPRFMEHLLHPDDRRRWADHWDEVTGPGGTEGAPPQYPPHPVLNFRIIHPDGGLRWIEHQCSPVFDSDGRYRGRRGVNRDITLRKQAEERAELMARLYATLSETNRAILRAETAERMLENVVQVVVMVGGYQACAVTLRDAASGVTELKAHLGLSPGSDLSIPWDGLVDGAPVIESLDASSVGAASPTGHPGKKGDPAAQRSAAVVLHYPLRTGAGLIGALSIAAPGAHSFSGDGLDPMGQLASDLSHALTFFAETSRRREAERALAESESRYRRIVETTLEGVWLLDTRLRVLQVNEALAESLGYRIEEMVGRSALDFMFPEDHADQLKRMERRRSGRSENYQRRLRRRDGQEAVFRIAASPLVDAAGEYEGSFAVLSNVTLRKQAEEALQRNVLLRGLFDQSPVAMFLLEGHELRVKMVNAEFTRKIGYSVEEIGDAQALWVRTYPDPVLRKRARGEWIGLFGDASVMPGPASMLETRLVCRDGMVRSFRVHVANIGEDHLVVLVDISELRDSERRLSETAVKLRQTARAFESATEALVIADVDARIVSANPAYGEITGYATNQAIGGEFSLLTETHLGARRHASVHEALRKCGRWSGEVRARRKNGDQFPAWLTVTDIRNSEGLTTHYVAVFSDISLIRRSEAQIRFLAHNDRLTRLPNWLALMDRLRHTLNNATEDARVAVLFVDLDRFKQVNDSLGHTVGDGLLQAVAQRLVARVRVDEMVARIGGDEFVIVLHDGPELKHTHDVAATLGEAFQRPLYVRSNELFVTASIGISIYPTDGGDPESLLKHADLAMYHAKVGGRNGAQFYQAEMATDADARLRIENALRGALKRGEFAVHYQPQVNLQTGSMIGTEALLRWEHPELGRVPPSLFIPIAEDMGIIDDIGAWVLEKSCQQLQTWDDQGIHVPRVAVNLSVRELESDSLTRRIEHLLNEAGLDSERLELEITESMIMRQAEKAIDVLTRVRALGVPIAVDDFGTGYSSLGYIQRLPLDRLKIDASFVRDIGRSADGENIVRAIIGLGRSLGLDVVAEGIERQEQVDFLVSAGCTTGQGYLFGAPVAPEEIPPLLSGKTLYSFC